MSDRCNAADCEALIGECDHTDEDRKDWDERRGRWYYDGLDRNYSQARIDNLIQCLAHAAMLCSEFQRGGCSPNWLPGCGTTAPGYIPFRYPRPAFVGLFR